MTTFITRRTFAAVSAASIVGNFGKAMADPSIRYVAPSEEQPHQMTVMAFATDAEGIWEQPSRDHAGLNHVRSDLMDIAKAIGSFEPVTMVVLNEAEKTAAEHLLARASAANPDIHALYQERKQGRNGVRFVVKPGAYNDYWTRDTAPLFVKDTANSGALAAFSLNFNGWGNANSRSSEAPKASQGTKRADFFQPYDKDRTFAATIAAMQGVPLLRSELTLEGGALEWDGEGTVILTRSSVLHVNRNPHLFDLTISKGRIVDARLKPEAEAIVAAELRRMMGVTKVLWLSGTDIFPAVDVDDETDITNGHVDFYAKFLRPGVVAYASDSGDTTGEKAITARHRQELTGATDARGRPLQLVPLETPAHYGGALTKRQMTNFAAGYINFYACNGALIMPKFGDTHADAAAAKAIAPYADGRRIVQVNITGIASGGGGLHCATNQIPA